MERVRIPVLFAELLSPRRELKQRLKLGSGSTNVRNVADLLRRWQLPKSPRPRRHPSTLQPNFHRSINSESRVALLESPRSSFAFKMFTVKGNRLEILTPVSSRFSP